MSIRTKMKRTAPLESLYTRGRPNSLNAIRLVLAAAVILWHSYAALDVPRITGGLRELVGAFPVNGFFAISGFLIYRSWQNKPSAREYLTARALRIYPAFWACLLVTAFIFAPLATAIQGGNPLVQAFSWDSVAYVGKNASLAMLQWRIGDSPTGIPFTESWNASLWTLAWEFLCYIGLLILGLLGMTTRRWLLPLAFLGSLVINAVALTPIEPHELIQRVGRFSIFFIAGALVAQYAHRLPARWWFGALTTAIAITACWLPVGHYFVQAAATALGLITLGGLINPQWATLRNDISYGVYIYAFPVQQLLVTAGVLTLGVLEFSLIAFVITVPIAMASWYLIEKPALRMRSRLGYPAWFRSRTLVRQISR